MTAPGEPLRVIYIVGMGHSGSTLLDFLLSGHSRITSVGEAKTLATKISPCTCRRSLEDCPFWSAVSRRIETAVDRTLRGLHVLGPEPDFGRDNGVFFRAVAQEAGTDWVVDSSKSPQRLKGLLESQDLEVLPIHLIRDPRGVVFSNLRKGRSLERYAERYVDNFHQARALLYGRSHIVVHYEWLASQPRAALQAIQAWLGRPFEERQLDWGSRDRHNLEGNRLRFAPGGEIQVDSLWQSALDAGQQSAILELTREVWSPPIESGGLHHHAQHARSAVLDLGEGPR
jgi:hypothetical protein